MISYISLPGLVFVHFWLFPHVDLEQCSFGIQHNFSQNDKYHNKVTQATETWQRSIDNEQLYVLLKILGPIFQAKVWNSDSKLNICHLKLLPSWTLFIRWFFLNGMQTEVLFKHLSLFLSSPDKSYLLILLNFVWNFRNYLILQHTAHWTCTFEGHGAHVSSSTNLPLKTKSSQNQVKPKVIVLFHFKKNVFLLYKLLHKLPIHHQKILFVILSNYNLKQTNLCSFICPCLIGFALNFLARLTW